MGSRNEHIEKMLAKEKANREKFDYSLLSEMIKEKSDFEKVFVDHVDEWTTALCVCYNRGWFIGKTWGNATEIIEKSEYRVRKINQIIE